MLSKIIRNGLLVILPVITLGIGWQLGMVYEQRQMMEYQEELDFLFSGRVGSGQIVENPEKEVDITILWSVWKILARHYIAPEKLQATPMLHGAVKGLVAAIDDPYTSFMPPEENKEFKSSLNGTLQGIGAELTQKDERIIVVAPLKGSPAEKAGLMPEDVITEVNGESMDGKTLSEAVSLIRGPEGTKVNLTLLRGSPPEAITLEIIREEIKVPSTEWEMKEHGGKKIGYISLNRFGDDTTNEVKEALEELRGAGALGLIIDVRFNGGGYLDRAVELSSMFLTKGKVVSVARRSGEPTHHYVSGDAIAPDLPLVILINEGSASASEILAGALQDNGRATVIGKKSFGKGTVQEVYDLPGGTSLRVTTARWLTPNGRDLGSDGVHPDIEVERTQEEIEQEIDPQLDKALEVIVEKITG